MGMVMQGKDLNITYETLFEILMREKDRGELQKLDESFIDSVNQYLAEKKAVLENKNRLDVFAAEEREKTEKQIQNIYRIIKELYDRREKKIMNMAIIRARTETNIIDTTGMLEKERRLLEETVSVLNKYRKEILLSMMEARAPKPEFRVPEYKPELEKLPVTKTRLIRFIHPVPKFLGRELEVYGPFDEEDVASLPEEIANILIEKGRVEEITQ